MRLKIHILGTTLHIIFCFGVFTGSPCHAVAGKGSAYVSLGSAINDELTTLDTKLDGILYNVPTVLRWKITNPTIELRAGVTLPTSLPILSHLRFQVHYSYAAFGRNERRLNENDPTIDIDSLTVDSYYVGTPYHRNHPRKLKSSGISIYYDLFTLFNVTPYVGAEIGYIEVTLPIYTRFREKYSTERKSLLTGGINVRFPRTSFALFVEYSYGTHREIYPGFCLDLQEVFLRPRINFEPWPPEVPTIAQRTTELRYDKHGNEILYKGHYRKIHGGIRYYFL